MEQRSEEWYAARKGRVTASMAGAIMGVAPYQTRAQALRRMVRDACGAEPEFTGNIATDYGTYNEAGALIDYRLETGDDVRAVGFIAFEDWAGCSPDGLIGNDGGLEIKCPFGKRKDVDPVFKTLADQPHYYAQVQFSLYVTGRDWWNFYQWAPAKSAQIEVILPDHKWRDENLPKLRQFYAEFLDAMNDPAEYLAPARVEIDGMEASKMLAEYDEMAEAEDRAKDRKREIMEELTRMAGGRDALVCGRKLTQVKREGAVSYAKAIANYAPDADLEPFRGKGSSSWRLT